MTKIEMPIIMKKVRVDMLGEYIKYFPFITGNMESSCKLRTKIYHFPAVHAHDLNLSGYLIYYIYY
jgi:hypothetical protein